MKRPLPLHWKMLIGGVGGATLGLVAHVASAGDPRLDTFIRYVTTPVGQVFLRLLFMLVIPLLVSALAMGVAGLGDVRELGRIGLKTLVYTVSVSVIAAVLGVALVNLLQPGTGIAEDKRQILLARAQQASGTIAATSAAPKAGFDLLIQMVPSNPVKAAADGDMLGVMVFALFLGIGLSLTPTEASRKLQGALEGLYEVSMTLIGIVIRFAPYAVAALLFNLTAQIGFDALTLLARYVGVVVLALAIHQFIVYGALVKVFGGMSPRVFFSGIEEAMLTAFSTSSSNATLPTALRVAEEKLKLPPHVSRFVLTIGSTANQNGTALFEGVTVLFLAQFYGVELGLARQMMVVGICVLGGIGTAGVPAGSLPVVALILGMVGVPPEGIGMILGVDRFLDMCRTTLNVSGDLAAAVVISRGERA
ncbi:MAG TPA: dicarboxylate/amino acid:cation symporter [Candidatus Polarisedimenticolaceae bacterium]|nr:dicarboxylate/amino acid:cation symporter [Candidatus Polarisedimenticolaceae bacterium]